VVPQEPGMPKNFHRADRRGCERLVQKENGDVNHGSALPAMETDGVNAYLQWHICHLVASRICKYFLVGE